MEDYKTYEMLLENELTDGVFTVSIVDSPAIERDFILLNKEKDRIEIKLDKISDNDRHVLTGPALVPNIIIPRKGHNITFSDETIRKISENFIMSNNKDRVNIQHSININKAFLIETWIVEDETNDKAYALGYTKEEVPAGTWMVSFKIKDNILWDEYLKSGFLKGFSIEGVFTQKEVHTHEHTELSAEDQAIYDIYLAINFTADDLETKYQWKMFNEENPCPSCKGFNGQIMKLKDWLNTAIPKHENGTPLGTTGVVANFPHSPYSTYCESACICVLNKVTKVAESKRGGTVVMPW